METKAILYNNFIVHSRRDTVRIHYDVAQTAHDLINIYNLHGCKISTLINSDKVPYSYQARWSGSDILCNVVESGIYILYIKIEEY